jgi:hypothetical protein
MDHQETSYGHRNHNNALTVAGFAGGVLALEVLITVILAFGRLQA